MTALVSALGDGMTVTKRNLIKMKRVPDIVVFTLIQPIMFVLLFAYVFGGAIKVPGVNYREFLIGGIFVQTVAFGTMLTAIGLADDLQKGIIDRFRSLPMARSAVLIGRTTSDLLNNGLVVIVMSVCGLIVGWRIHDGFIKAVGGFALLFLFAYSMSWVAATIGLAVRSVEVAQSAGFIWMFPLTFLSNAFVPIDSMPGWLQAFANWNPISAVIAAIRELFGNVNPAAPPVNAWPMQHAIVASIGWCALILAVFVPLAIRKYRIAAAR